MRFEDFVRLPQEQKKRVLAEGRKRNERHYLYRCFDKQGSLLYIGCTHSVGQRMELHRVNRRSKSSRWLTEFMDRYEVEGPIVGRDSARQAESAAILNEQPLFNIQGRQKPGWMILGRVAAYLIANDRGDLALETACTCWSDATEPMDDCVAHHPELAVSA